ncbi:YciI family protein [Thalassotalea atypica]|uniref:YciI family protein n=1 Tax=Thalassotalea atypica TaxID=2054316 RepID=UPI0025722085|nr:YciI family protein [Thalassotalea atypica]
MKNNTYMCILRSATGTCEKPSPSEMEIMYAKYQAWQQEFADNILDMGNKLGSVASVVRHDQVTDGPFIELKEVVGGYMMLTAHTLEQAIAVIKASPMVSNAGTSIEIREICTP